MRCRQLADAFINRKRSQHVIKGEILPQGVEVQIWFDGRVRQQNFWLGSKEQGAIEDSPVERLLTEPIARNEQPLALFVPQRKGEHAVEMLDHVAAVFVVKMRQDFRV